MDGEASGQRARRAPGELPSPASLNDVAYLYLARSDSKRNSIYTRLWIIMDEAKANLRAPMPLRQLAEITDFNLFLTLARGKASYCENLAFYKSGTF